MNIDKQLKQLNNMPEDEALKKRMKDKIVANEQSKRHKSFAWKELSLIVGICCIAFFLLIIPTNVQQADSAEITHIYTYFGGKEGVFKAKSSRLYTNIEDKKSATTIEYFNDLGQLEPVPNGQLGEHIVDVIVVRGHEENRYQISDTLLLDIETGVYYADHTDSYAEVFNELYQAKLNGFTIVVPVSVIFINILAQNYYKKRKIKVPDKIPGTSKFIITTCLSLFLIMGYYILVGPIYMPLLSILWLLYIYILWRNIKRFMENPIILRVEKIKIIVLSIVIFYFIWTL